MKKLTKKAVVMMALMIAGTASAAYEDTVRRGRFCDSIAEGSSIIRMKIDIGREPKIEEYLTDPARPNTRAFIRTLYEEAARAPRNTVTPEDAYKVTWARCMDSIDEYVFRDRAASN